MTSAKPMKGLPEPDDLDAAFYRATAEAGRLMIQCCSACGRRTHPARYFCPSCSSPDFTFQPVSGRARVHSWTVSHFSVESAWKDRLPFVTIVAELEEGPRVVARTDTITPQSLALESPITVSVEVVSSDFSYLWAAPEGTP